MEKSSVEKLLELCNHLEKRAKIIKNSYHKQELEDTASKIAEVLLEEGYCCECGEELEIVSNMTREAKCKNGHWF